MSGHARLSPSKRARWMRCPGSIREEAKCAEQRNNAAVDGTHSHTLLEHCMNEGVDPLEMVGEELSDDDGSFVVDEGRAKRVKVAVDYVNKRKEEEGPNCKVISETLVDPAHLVGRYDMSGTVDIQIHGSEVLEIVDYKDGMVVVDAFENPQLEQYAIGVLAELKLPSNAPYPFKTVRMTIIQPKNSYNGSESITSHDLSIEEMLVKVAQIIKEAEATDDPNAPLIPGDIQCKYCLAKGSCGALAKKTFADLGIQFPVIAQSSEKTTVQIDSVDLDQPKDPQTLTNEQIRKIFEASSTIKDFLEAVEEEAFRRISSGNYVPGLKIVNGKGSRSWAFDEDAIADKLKSLGVPEEHLFEKKILSPAKVDKLVWSTSEGQRKLSSAQLKQLETESVVKLAGKPTLTLETDKRPAIVNSNVAALFGAVNSQTPPPQGFVNPLPSWLSKQE